MLPKKPKSFNPGVVLRYSGMAFEMLFTILAGWWFGKQIDAYFNYEKPVFQIILILGFTIFSLYRVIKSLDKLNQS